MPSRARPRPKSVYEVPPPPSATTNFVVMSPLTEQSKPLPSSAGPSLPPQKGCLEECSEIHFWDFNSVFHSLNFPILFQPTTPTLAGARKARPLSADMNRVAPSSPSSSSANCNDNNELLLLLFLIGGREVGQVTVFKRPISIWRLDLTKTF